MEPTPNKDIEAFRKGLRQACEDTVTKRTALGDFIKTHEPPWECRGNKDRTNGFYWVTTVLKTLGAKVGVQALMDINPRDTDIETGCLVVFDKPLRDISWACAKRLACVKLVRDCMSCRDSIKEVLTYEDDHVMQHALTSLQGELDWCVRETDPDGCPFTDTPHADKEKRYCVTCICHGDTCDGHATTLGVVATKDAALEIISDDKQIFKDNLQENGIDLSDINDRPSELEIWYGTPGEHGRVYDIHEI